MFLLLGMFLISFASSIELQPIKKIGYDWDNEEQFTKDITTSKYGKYEIRNAVLGLSWFQYGHVADIELKNNSDVCGEDCFAEKEVILYNDGILVDEVSFETLQGDGSWEYQPIRSYQFSYQGEIQDYRTECSEVGQQPNGTIIEECIQVEDGTHVGKINYKEGEVVRAGTYLLRLDGSKKPSRTVDWKIKTNGIWTNEWATWGNITLGADAEVLLNSPNDNNVSLTSVVEFNCSANITGGSFLGNMSLYTNESGVWEAKNSTTFEDIIGGEGLVSYYELDEASGNAADSVGSNTGIATGITYGNSGIIDDSFTFDVGSSDNVNTTFTPSGTAVTYNAWIYFTSTPEGTHRVMSNFETDAGFLLSMSSGNILARRGDGGAIDTVTSTFDFTDNGTEDTWYMVTGTWDDATHDLKVYVNGQLNGTLNDAGNINFGNNNTLIGNRPDLDRGFPGRIDEVGIWDVSLTDSEILSLYDDGIAGDRPTIGSTTSKTQTWNRTISESTLWTCQACDSDGDCGFATSNRTVSIDTSKPIIVVESPVGALGYVLVGGNETLNVTFTDINLDTCWYDYNGTNYTIDGCVTGIKNSTNFIIEIGNTNMTVYANDSLGNINSTFVDWSYNLTENSQTYPSTSLESATETYTANLSYNSSNYAVITGILTLNGTQYLGTRTGTGDSAILSANAVMPSVSEETNLTAYWTIGLTDDSGIISYNLTSHNVTVSIINLSLCGSPLTVPFWNFTILNESNSVEINSTFEVTFSVKQTGSTTANEFSFADTTGVESTFDFCLSPSTESYTIDSSIKLTKPGFVDKFYNYQSVVVSNATRTDNLYMLATEDSTSFIVHVVYVDSSDVIGAEVNVQRYYQGSGEWVTTEILTTNYIGEAVGHLLSEDADYRFNVSVDGVNIFTSSATKITCAVSPCTVTLTIPIDIPTGVETIDDFTSSLMYSGTTNIFTYTYSDTSGDFSSARLYVVGIFPSNSSQNVVCNETKTDFSGVITCDTTGQINGTYQASGYLTRTTEVLTKRINGVLGTNIYNAMGLDGVLWAFFIMIAMIMIGVNRPSLAIISGTIGLLLIGLLQIINIGAISMISVTSIAIILLMRVGRE